MHSPVKLLALGLRLEFVYMIYKAAELQKHLCLLKHFRFCYFPRSVCFLFCNISGIVHAGKTGRPEQTTRHLNLLNPNTTYFTVWP